MSLTPAQVTALANDLAANTAVITLAEGQVQIKNAVKSADNADAVASWYNLFPGTNFFGYYRSVPLSAIKGAIGWKKLTPTDTVPTDTALNVQIWTARATMCDLCRANVMALMSMGSAGVIDATPVRIVQGFLDALSTVPSGVSGVPVDAGWANLQPVLCRLGTNAEKLFASTTNGNGAATTTPASFGPYEGNILSSDIRSIWGI